MEMFYTALKPILFQGNSRKYQNSDFELSNSLESIIDRLDGKDPACFVVYGEPGSGRTTLLSKVCDTLLERNLIRQSDICGLRVRAGCSVQSLWNFLSGISKDRQDKDTASLLLQSSAKLSKKHKAAQDFISSNFKLVCVDDVYSDGGLVWSHLSQLLPKIKAHVIVVSARKEAPLIQSTVTEQTVLSVELKGIGMDSFKHSLSNKLSDWQLSDNELWRICTMLNGNPTSLKILTNAVNELKLPPESFDCALLSYSEPLSEEEASSVLMVLQFVFQHLTVWEKQVLGQLCQLREPLPLRTVVEEIGNLVRLGLVDKETISDDTKTIKGIYSVSVACCIQLSSLQLINTSDNDSLSPEAQLHFSVFDLWYGLLSEKLHQLVKDAQGNAWPFVPEKWQYITNVGAEERYNIKELITANNSFVPHLTEQDILEECLFQAVKEKMYSTVAALVFVTDRFNYWQGSSHTTLQLVEYLKTNSPDTAIAPQILIRKVRVMKNAGDLHGAERALDELLVKKSQVGKWVYKQKHDHQLVSAVCIQIKGDIQYNLGQWLQGAKLLIESLILFSTLPIPDTKGISSSLAILANCLEQMSLSEYIPLAQMYGLRATHPLLQAYYCSYESALRSQYTPLFYARHKCRAAEFMLHYSQLIPDDLQRQEHLHIATEDFKDSIQAHTDLQSLTSREEFFVFVCAVHKLGVTYQAMASQGSIQQAQLLDNISLALYEHYCSFTGAILLDKEITKVISYCLSILQLKPFCDEELSNTEWLIEAHGERRSSAVTTSDTKGEQITQVLGSSSWETSNIDHPGVQASVDTTNEEFVFASHEAVLKVRHEGHSVTDKLRETWERMASKSDTSDIVSAVIHSNQVNSGKNASGLGFTVDRCCDTKDKRSYVTMETVDRSIVTQNLESETVHLPSERFQGLKLDSGQRVQGAIVWRYDFLSKEWRGDKTLACVGDLLELAKGKEGAQRNAFMVEFIDQEDPFAKYVAKSYKKTKNTQQYQQDVICQMTARHYAMLFNQEMNRADVNVGHIEFLPVVLLQLVNENGSLSGVYNVERYMAGEFVKLTNNLNYVTKQGLVSDLVLAFSHFTYQASNQQLIIVDIQGWTPASNQTGCTFLTDPQIHSVVYKCFGTGNLRQKGIDSFWNEMHPQCNDLCKELRLVRPNVTKSP